MSRIAHSVKHLGAALLHRPEPFLVDGVRAYRTIGVLVGCVGVTLVLAGGAMQAAGALGMARYEEFSGRMARWLSTGDRTYFAYLERSVAVGRAVTIAGGVVLLAGVCGAVWPQSLHNLGRGRLLGEGSGRPGTARASETVRDTRAQGLTEQQ